MLENILTPAIPLVLLVLVGFTLLRSTMASFPNRRPGSWSGWAVTAGRWNPA